jgi:hypothetical protein
MKIKTEFSFKLPDRGESEKPVTGKMRLIKVRDLIDINRDMRVKENSAYFYIVLLNRIITQLGEIRNVNSNHVESLSSKNFAFLVDFMNEINHKILKNFPVRCNNCDKVYTGEVTLVGEL